MSHQGRTPPPLAPLPSEADLERDFVTHIINGPRVRLDLSAHEAFSLMSTMRLALQHPEFPRKVRQQLQRLMDQLQKDLSRTPSLAAVVRAGGDPRYDVPREDDDGGR